LFAQCIYCNNFAILDEQESFQSSQVEQRRHLLSIAVLVQVGVRLYYLSCLFEAPKSILCFTLHALQHGTCIEHLHLLTQYKTFHLGF